MRLLAIPAEAGIYPSWVPAFAGMVEEGRSASFVIRTPPPVEKSHAL
jgi:hypothetical protein